MTDEQRLALERYCEIWQDEEYALVTNIRAALAEIEALRKYRERLDKLVNKSSRLTLVHGKDGSVTISVTIFDDMTGSKLSAGNDLREAIDAMEVKP